MEYVILSLFKLTPQGMIRRVEHLEYWINEHYWNIMINIKFFFQFISKTQFLCLFIKIIVLHSGACITLLVTPVAHPYNHIFPHIIAEDLFIVSQQGNGVGIKSCVCASEHEHDCIKILQFFLQKLCHFDCMLIISSFGIGSSWCVNECNTWPI